MDSAHLFLGTIMKSFFIKLIILLSVFCFDIQLLAHHTGVSHNPNATTRFVDPFTGKREKPEKYIVFTQDYYKETNEKSNISTTTVFGEIPLYNGLFSVNASVPYTYFQQKNREDAGRVGKIYLGTKIIPFLDLSKDWFFSIDLNLGFPSGPDTDKITGGNFYAGQGSFTFGYLYDKWNFVVRGGGIQPLSRLRPTNLSDNDGIPYYLRPATAEPPSERIELKKATIWSFYTTYFLTPNISILAGYLYRTPYQGVEFDTSTKNTIPRFFKEVSAGGGYSFSESKTIYFTVRYPLYRNDDHRLYDLAYSLAYSMEFDK
jgi:hypothetical protein